MRILIQRVSRASVFIAGREKSAIGAGMLVLLGVEHNDTPEDVLWLVKKTARLRIFDDPSGVMNLDIAEVGGRVIVVSQFTLHASTKKGNRPSYIRSAKEDKALPLYEMFVRELGIAIDNEVLTGEFGADMQVELINDGPVTIFIDSKNRE